MSSLPDDYWQEPALIRYLFVPSSCHVYQSQPKLERSLFLITVKAFCPKDALGSK